MCTWAHRRALRMAFSRWGCQAPYLHACACSRIASPTSAGLKTDKKMGCCRNLPARARTCQTHERCASKLTRPPSGKLEPDAFARVRLCT